MAECLSYKTGGLEVGGVLMPTCQAGCVLVQKVLACPDGLK